MYDVSEVAIYPDIWDNDSWLAGSLLHLTMELAKLRALVACGDDN